MKKLFLIFLFIPTLVIGQPGRYPFASTPMIESGASYSDDFDSYATGNLDEKGSWDSPQPGADIQIIDNSGDKVFSGNEIYDAVWYWNETVEDDQYSQITIDAIVSNIYVGVSVRMDATDRNHYYWMGDDSESFLRVRYNDGVGMVTFATGDGWATTDVIKLTIEGYVLKCYKNGVLDTSIDTDGIYTDASEYHSTGYPGIYTYGTGATYGDDWEGGDL